MSKTTSYEDLKVAFHQLEAAHGSALTMTIAKTMRKYMTHARIKNGPVPQMVMLGATLTLAWRIASTITSHMPDSGATPGDLIRTAIKDMEKQHNVAAKATEGTVH